MNIILYHSVESTCAQKVRLALAEKDLEWEERRLNLRRGDQFSTDYLALNPKGVVPTLIHENKVFRESTIINEYLDDVFPHPALKPPEPGAAAQMRLWVKTFDDDVHPSIGVITYATVLRHQMAQMKSAEELAAHFANMPDPARRMRQMSVHEDGMEAAPAAQALNQLDGVLTRMDQHLETVPWLGGDTYSLADCAAAPYILRLDQLQFSGLWSDGLRHLEGWYSRVSKRNSFQTLLENYMSQSLQELFREYGRRTWPKVEEILAANAQGR